MPTPQARWSTPAGTRLPSRSLGLISRSGMRRPSDPSSGQPGGGWPGYGFPGATPNLHPDPEWPNEPGGGGGPPDTCFTGDTLITLADGSGRRIADMQVGDIVRTQHGVGTVAKVFEHEATQYRRLMFGPSVLDVTDEHPLFHPETERWVAAKLFQIGDTAQRVDGPTTLTEIAGVVGVVPVYNLHVEPDETYYANGILVHNKTPPIIPGEGGPAATPPPSSGDTEQACQARGGTPHYTSTGQYLGCFEAGSGGSGGSVGGGGGGGTLPFPPFSGAPFIPEDMDIGPFGFPMFEHDFNFPDFPDIDPFDYESFVPPTWEEVLNDQGYQFRLQEGQKALEQSAAARGTLRTSGTFKDILGWGQGLASNEYAQVYGRRFGEHQQGFSEDLTEWDREYAAALDRYRAEYGSEMDQFNAAMGIYGMNFNTAQTIYDYDWRRAAADAGFGNQAGMFNSQQAFSAWMAQMGHGEWWAQFLWDQANAD